MCCSLFLVLVGYKSNGTWCTKTWCNLIYIFFTSCVDKPMSWAKTCSSQSLRKRDQYLSSSILKIPLHHDHLFHCVQCLFCRALNIDIQSQWESKLGYERNQLASELAEKVERYKREGYIFSKLRKNHNLLHLWIVILWKLSRLISWSLSLVKNVK